MRLGTWFMIPFGVALIAPRTALADRIPGTYDVHFEDVSTNCATPLEYTSGKLELEVDRAEVAIAIERLPTMLGEVTREGRVSAMSRPSLTPIAGVTGVFSIAGTMSTAGALSLVMVAEYTVRGRELCSQSWNVTGVKATPES